MKLLFRNPTVVSSQGQERCDVCVEDGTIVEHFSGQADEVIEAEGRLLLPGLIDSHVHFREPGLTHKEDWESGSRAAALRGVTTVLEMPNTMPPTTTLVALEGKRKLAQAKSCVHFGLFFGVTSENIEEMRRAKGIVGFKMYTGASTGNLLVDQPAVWEAAFQVARERNLPIVVHAESQALIEQGIRDCSVALEATQKMIVLQEKIGNKLHIAHLSCKQEVDFVRAHKNPNLSCEVTPHHLFFTEKDRKDGFLKVYPPLRSEADREALWQGIQGGTVDVIATDHAPHTLEEKAQGFEKAPAGVPGVDFLLPLLLNWVHEGRLSLEQLVRLTAENPARIFSFSQKGFIKAGFDADLVLVDKDAVHTIEKQDILSKCAWSPYQGLSLHGWPLRTWISGRETTK